MTVLNESIVEAAALEWFEALGYAIGHGPHIAPDESAAEWHSFDAVVLVGHLREPFRTQEPPIADGESSSGNSDLQIQVDREFS